jgi:hypothetical protein
MLTLWGAVALVSLILLAGIAWLLTRDTPTPPSPGRHQPKRRDPHDPVVRDDEPPPDQD